jgi:hypothetical protein
VERESVELDKRQWIERMDCVLRFDAVGTRRAETEKTRMTNMKVADYKELRVYQLAFESAMVIFQQSKRFPSEERYSLTDQIRRSSGVKFVRAEQR